MRVNLAFSTLELKKATLQFYRQSYLHFKPDTNNSSILIKSKSYCDYLLEKSKMDVLFQGSTLNDKIPTANYSLDSLFKALTNSYSGLLQERLITTAVVLLFDHKENSDECLKRALIMVTHPYFRNMLEELSRSKARGVKAYPFALPDSNQKIVQLSDFKGKVIVIDFWYTGCGACRHLAEGMHEVVKSYLHDTSVVFLTISIDLDFLNWKRSLIKGLYTSAGEINLYTGGKGIEDPSITSYNIEEFPELFIIDKLGRIYSTHPVQPWDDDPKLIRQFTELLELAKKI